MASLKSITFITKDDPLEPVDGRTGVLLECAADSDLPGDPQLRTSYGELVGAYQAAKEWAVRTMHTLIANEPVIEGIRHLEIIEESIIQELERIYHVIRLNDWLKEHEIEDVVFRRNSPFADSLGELGVIGGYRVHRPSRPGRSLIKRGIQVGRNRGFASALRLSVQRKFPCAARLFLSDRSREPFDKSATWCYSTAYTYTSICMEYESFLPGTIHYLYESDGTSGELLKKRDNSGFDIYSWGRWGDIPSRKFLEQARKSIEQHLHEAILSDHDSRARVLFLRGSMFRDYLLRRLPLMIFKGRLFRRWIENVAPRMIVVGNPGTERALLQLATQQGIPTVCLQHGILGDYYQYCSQPCDALLVRGPFWRQFVVEEMRNKTYVLNSTSSVPHTANSGVQRSSILFVTSIEAALPTTHSNETFELIRILLECAHQEGRGLIVRVHPRESVEYYKNVTEKAMRSLSLSVPVEFSKGPGLEGALERSAVAVMYSSTVFLDCLRFEVPVVSLDWIDFSYKNLLQKHEVFHFARNLKHLRELVLKAVRGELTPKSDSQEFLADTRPEELKRFFEAAILRGRVSGSVGQKLS